MKKLVAQFVSGPIGKLKNRIGIWRRKRMYSRQDGPFCSGEGSVKEEIILPYCDQVRAFIHAHQIHSVVDLGCGDFGVGGRLLDADLRYTGVDIVAELIEYNQQRFANANVQFRCLNIIDDELPEADLCLVRQVLQHLSNAEIQRILKKLRIYKYAIVTEHLYSGPGFRPNLDKPHGPGTRIPLRSGVHIGAAPFSCNANTLLEVPLLTSEVLRTAVIESGASFSQRY